VLPKVDEKEHQPERFIDMPLALVHHGSHQWVEDVVVRVGTTRARFAGAYDRDILDPVNAL
jgi:hypothetical protein